MNDRNGLFIGGRWTAALSGLTAPVISPVREAPLGDCPQSGAEDTAAALASAAMGLALWRGTSAFDRAEALHRIADEMLRRADEANRMISLETGKPLVQSGRESALSVDQFRWYAGEARRIYGRFIESWVAGGRFEVHHEPVGINAFAMAAAEAPFGGTNHSGTGREGCCERVRDHLEVKSSQMVWA